MSTEDIFKIAFHLLLSAVVIKQLWIASKDPFEYPEWLLFSARLLVAGNLGLVLGIVIRYYAGL